MTKYSWGGYASTEFCVVPELNLYQVFIRQYIPTQTELNSKAFGAAFSDPAIGPVGSSGSPRVHERAAESK